MTSLPTLRAQYAETKAKLAEQMYIKNRLQIDIDKTAGELEDIRGEIFSCELANLVITPPPVRIFEFEAVGEAA